MTMQQRVTTRGRAAAMARNPAAPGLRRLLALTALCAAASFTVPATALAQTWDGETNTLWSIATNWSSNVVPAAGGTVHIMGDGGANQPTLNVNSNALQATNISAGTLTVDAVLTSTVVTLSGTGNLTINAGDSVNGSVNMGSTGTLLNNGSIIGPLTITNGVTNNAGVVTGPTTISGGILNLVAGTSLAAGQAFSVNGGTVNVSFADVVGSMTMSAGNLQGLQTLTVAGAYGQSGGAIGSGVTVNAAGAKSLSGGTISGTLGGAGPTTLQGGTATLLGTIVGDMTIAATGHLVGGPSAMIDGSLTSSGSFTPGGITITGDLTLMDLQSRLFGELNSLLVTGSAFLGGELSFDPTGVDFDSDYVEAELLRASGGIFDDFNAINISGPAGYAVGSRIEVTDFTSRYLITYTRVYEVQEPSVLALAALGLLCCFGTRRWRLAPRAIDKVTAYLFR